MIKISQVNAFLFVLMFLFFVFASKVNSFFGEKIIGLEYYAWFVFTAILITLHWISRNPTWRLRGSYLVMSGVLLVFCILNFFYVDVPLLRYAQGTFFSFLFVLNFILFYNIRFRKEHFFTIARFVVLTITFIGVCAYIERIAYPGEYTSYSLRGVWTITKDPSFAAALLNINIILCLALYLITRRRVYVVIILFSIITIALMLYVKAFLSAIIICFVFVMVYFNSRALRVYLYVMGGVFFSMLILLGEPLYAEIEYKFSMYFGPGYKNIPRNALYIASVEIATDYFPFGSGQGTFGSLPVGKEYSQIYYDYHLNTVQGLGPENALRLKKDQFIFDTHWSSIIGEMGFVAGLIYLLVWFFPAAQSLKHIRSGDTELAAIAFAILMMTVSIFIESIAAPLPGQLQFIMLYAGLGGMGLRLFARDVVHDSAEPQQS